MQTGVQAMLRWFGRRRPLDLAFLLKLRRQFPLLLFVQSDGIKVELAHVVAALPDLLLVIGTVIETVCQVTDSAVRTASIVWSIHRLHTACLIFQERLGLVGRQVDCPILRRLFSTRCDGARNAAPGKPRAACSCADPGAFR